jgi:hypothetical protein
VATGFVNCAAVLAVCKGFQNSRTAMVRKGSPVRVRQRA